MAPRAGIIAGRAVIVVQVQESIDRSLATISTKLNRFSAQLSRIGLELFSGGLIGSIVTTSTLKTFKEFEDRLLFLSTKLKTTEAEFLKVTERIRELGRSTSFTAIQVADAATVLAQAGLNAREVIETLQPTLDLARGAQIELDAAGAILTNTMRSFGLETARAGDVASQFIAAARLGTLNVIDLKESIKEVLGTVRKLNIDLPTTLALITQLAERSLKGTKAGTSLNTALLQLASKGDVIKKQLGIIVPDNLDGDKFIRFLEELNARISSLGNRKQVAILQSLFNIRGGRAITGLDDIKKIINLQKEIRNAGNEAREAAKVMDSGLGGSLRIALSAAESLSITLGKILNTQIKPLIDVVPTLANSLEQLALGNETLVIGLLLTPPALLAIGAGLLVLSFGLSKVALLVGVIGVTFRTVSRAGVGLLTNSLVALSRTLGFTFAQLKALDRLASASFLSPQKSKKGAVKPSSFLSRLGATKLSGQGLASGTGSIVKSGLSLGISFANSIAKGIITANQTISKALASVFVPNKRLLAQQRAFNRTQLAFAGLNAPATSTVTKSKALASINAKTSAEVAKRANLQRDIAKTEKSIASLNSIIGKAKAKDVTAELAYLDKLERVNTKVVASNVKSARRKITVEKALADSRARTASFTAIRNENFFGSERTGSLAARKKFLDAQRALDIEEVRQLHFKRQIATLTQRATLSTDEIARRRLSVRASAAAPDVSAATARRNALVLERELLVQEARKRTTTIGALNTRAEKLEVTRIARAERKSLKAAIVTNAAKDKLQQKFARISSFKTASATTNLAKTSTLKLASTVGSGIKALFSGLGKASITFFKFLPKLLDLSVVGVLKLWKGFKTVLGVMKTLSVVAFRTLTTLSGWGNILTFLLIFGPHIKIIREAFERLGKGISEAFGTITGTFAEARDALSLFGSGFSLIVKGDGTLGLNAILDSLRLMGTIVKDNLVIAFNQLVRAVAPFYDFVRKIVSSLLEVFSLVGSIIGVGFTTAVAGISGITGGGSGSLLDSIKELFSSENLKGFFQFVGGLITEFGKNSIAIFQQVFSVVSNTMLFIREAFATVLRTVASASLNAAEGLSDSGFSGIFKNILADIGGAFTDAYSTSVDDILGTRTAISEMNKGFEGNVTKLDNSLGKFLANLDRIFSINTEVQSQAAIDAANSEKEAAKTEAEARAARAKAAREAPDTPIQRIGEFLYALRFNPSSLLPQGKQGAGPKVGSFAGFAGALGPKLGAQLNQLQSAPTRDQQLALLRSTLQRNKEEQIRLRKTGNALPKASIIKQSEDEFDRTNAPILRNREQLRQSILSTRETQEKLRQLKLAGAAQGPGASLKDIVSATVGTFRQTRGNLLKAAGGKSVDQQQLSTLQNINENLGGETSLLGELVGKATPLVFQ